MKFLRCELQKRGGSGTVQLAGFKLSPTAEGGVCDQVQTRMARDL